MASECLVTLQTRVCRAARSKWFISAAWSHRSPPMIRGLRCEPRHGGFRHRRGPRNRPASGGGPMPSSAPASRPFFRQGIGTQRDGSRVCKTSTVLRRSTGENRLNRINRSQPMNLDCHLTRARAVKCGPASASATAASARCRCNSRRDELMQD